MEGAFYFKPPLINNNHPVIWDRQFLISCDIINTVPWESVIQLVLSKSKATAITSRKQWRNQYVVRYIVLGVHVESVKNGILVLNALIAQRKMGARKLKQEKGCAAPVISLYTMWLYPQENLGLPFSFLVRRRVQFLIQKQTLYSKTCHSRYGSSWGGLDVLQYLQYDRLILSVSLILGGTPARFACQTLLGLRLISAARENLSV